jgi:DtxR family transcriptional regulator, Mn-dependent transcriptional regulator
MPSSTVENYVKQIYQAQQRLGPGRKVALGGIAKALGVVPGTATSMIKALADSGLVRYEPRHGVRLSRGGEQLALHVLRRHRLVELFLVHVLRLDWSEVHDEAEALEHVISDKVLARMDELLGHPSVDPHGDPIPSARGDVEEAALVSLDEAGAGARVTIARIADQEPSFLQYLNRHGLKPGTRVAVLSRDAEADAVTLTRARARLTLGGSAARKILVRLA